MPLARLAEPFDHPEWIFELKLDGFRSLAHVDRSGCRLMSRNRNPFKTFPLLASAIAEKLDCNSAVMDVEMCSIDSILPEQLNRTLGIFLDLTYWVSTGS
jgi:ATP-dependent DNA ligase